MAAQDVVITFDDLPVGTVVTNQYHNKGVDFFGQPSGGLLPVIAQVPPGEAHSGNQVANISTCEGCEFFVPFVTGRFTNTVEHISFFVGQFDGQPDSAQITLTAFDAGGTLLAQSAPATVTAGGGFNSLLSVEVALANIATFEVSARTNVDDNKQLGIDDLTFGSTQASPPDFGLVLSQTALEVAQGFSATDTIAVTRFNGSTGPIQFTASGLPQGVTATFVPNPVGGDSTTLTVVAASNAPLTGPLFVPVTITATPLSPSAGSVVRTALVSVSVRPDFTLGVKGSDQIFLTPCGTTTLTLTVTRDVTFLTEQINLSVSGFPPGIQSTLTPSSVGAPPAGSLVNVVTLSLTVSAGQLIPDTDIIVEATSGSQTSTLTLHLRIALASFSPTEGQAPQSLHVGTEVTILGAGFSSGSLVAFGIDTIPSPTGGQQPLALATPTSIRPDGRELHVNVPRLATDGPLSVITPEGNVFVSCDPFTVHTYRNTNGFQFPNFPVTGINFQNVEELYGHAQTHLTFTIFGITVDIANPFAQLYATVVDAALKGHKHCLGIALTAERILHGDQSLGAFPPPGATSIWQLDSRNGPSPNLAHYIHIQDIVQFSAEYMHAYLAEAFSHSVSASSSDIKSLVFDLLQAGDHPLVGIRLPLTDGFHGHVLNGYDLEAGPLGPDDFYIDVYDPEFQFVVEENRDGTLHQKFEEGSRVHVTPNARWQFGNFGPQWEGGFESLIILPYGAAPLHPTIPTSLDGLVKLIFGDGSQTQQIADTQGHMLFQADGSLNTDPATRLPQAAPFPVLDGIGPGRDMYLLAGDGPYIHTVRASSTSGYSYTLLNPGFATRVETETASLGVDDEVTLDPQASHLGFRTGVTRKVLKAHLLALAPDGDVRTAVVNTTSFKEGSSFAFDHARQTLIYQHAGPATDYTVTFEGTNRQSKRVKFVSPSLRVETGDKATFDPADWHHLGRTTVTLTVIHKDGTRSVQTLKNHKPDPDDDDMDDHLDEHDG